MKTLTFRSTEGFLAVPSGGINVPREALGGRSVCRKLGASSAAALRSTREVNTALWRVSAAEASPCWTSRSSRMQAGLEARYDNLMKSFFFFSGGKLLGRAARGLPPGGSHLARRASFKKKVSLLSKNKNE